MKLVFLSSSIKTLNINHMKTSSEKFEYELVYNLIINENIDVSIYSDQLKMGDIQSNMNVKLIGIRGKTKVITYKNFHSLLKKINKPDLIIFYGYDLMKVIGMIWIKYKNKIKTLSFIFDTHQGAIKNFSYVKKNFSNIYFNISIKLLRFLDGYLLFQKEAARELKLIKPYYVLKPGINKDKISNYLYNRNNYFTIIYMGSLMDYNGISEMLEAFQLCKNENMRFRIFGNGGLRNKVIEYSKKDSRVYYGGLVNQDVISNEFLNADLLLNLRDPNDYVCNFAYPSKLIEYMSSGVPVLSTNLKFDNDIKDCLYVVDRLDSIDIKDKIGFIVNDDIENIKLKTKKSKEYVIKNNNWETICKELVYNLDNFIKI